ncbi:putative H/ACA ribonucleoprotein complex subunit 1-like protein 1 [Helianthus annuus]|uniref:putative H/ACA ribonucleoprotein complex subunit 1-like protein 1 n=1 Tax=Helianthus annuus TaxID=4232 RepID=UPI001652E8B0|nr:putative H/ACA ribonucleoprotein complex subunit 1-like protein 1 [Helianthus annuus]
MAAQFVAPGGFGSRGGGRGGFRVGRDGGGRGGRNGGGRFGGDRFNEGPPEQFVEVLSFVHACEEDAVTQLTNEKIPYFNAPIYLPNKTQICKVDEIFGPINEYLVQLMNIWGAAGGRDGVHGGGRGGGRGGGSFRGRGAPRGGRGGGFRGGGGRGGGFGRGRGRS